LAIVDIYLQIHFYTNCNDNPLVDMEKRKLTRLVRPPKPKKKRLSRAERKAKLEAAQKNASSLFSQDSLETPAPLQELQKPEETDATKPEESEAAVSSKD
jgi:hypothetical protein